MTCDSAHDLTDSEIEALRCFSAIAETHGIGWAVVKRFRDDETGNSNGTIPVIIAKPLPEEKLAPSRCEQNFQFTVASDIVTFNCRFSRPGEEEMVDEALQAAAIIDGIPVLPTEWALIFRLNAGTPESNRFLFSLIGQLDRKTFRRFRRNVIKHYGKDGWNFGRSGFKVNRE